MRSHDDFADRFYQARAAQTAARDHLFVVLRRLLEKHGEITDAIAVGIKAATSTVPPADIKPLARAYARTDYAINEDHAFGRLVANERKPKKRKQIVNANGEGRGEPQAG